MLGLLLLGPGIARAQTAYKIQKIARLGEMAGDTLLPAGASYQFVPGGLNDSGQLLFLVSNPNVRRPAETGHLLDGWTTTGWRLGPIPRHSGGLNIGFLDGHAAWLSVRELARVDTDGRGSYWFHYGSADR